VLTEFPRVKQESGPGRRRWFEDDGMDLIVWYDAARGISGFQICYGVGSSRARALTWRRGQGFFHDVVDEGDERPDKNETPILIPDGEVSWEQISKEIVRRGDALEPELRSLIVERLTART
jgi:hypothetical protein